MKRLVPFFGLLVCVGCSGPSLEGTWNVTPGEPLPYPVQPTVQATFSKGGQGSVVIRAESEMPAIGKVSLEADVVGTWKMEGEKLVWTPQSTTIKPVNGTELPSFIADGIKKDVQENVGKNGTGKLKWEGNDKFTVTLESGKAATFDRVKT